MSAGAVARAAGAAGGGALSLAGRRRRRCRRLLDDRLLNNRGGCRRSLRRAGRLQILLGRGVAQQTLGVAELFGRRRRRRLGRGVAGRRWRPGRCLRQAPRADPAPPRRWRSRSSRPPSRTPRPTSTPNRKITTNTTVTAMNRKISCLPFSWISRKPSSFTAFSLLP